ncbi:MAG: hypothetical protein A4E42_01035 [Methanoregulaceae archaeon PtaU1.Bin222]|nr:MAG: hypothetical protein A4E42_01035 [Methanoregulaceae archaeon PtaU1.Bin222]
MSFKTLTPGRNGRGSFRDHGIFNAMKNYLSGWSVRASWITGSCPDRWIDIALRRTGVPEFLMSDRKQTCDVCGREAIGIQSLGCCASTVCEEHADPQMRSMKPGEKKEWGICFFHRFG